MIHKVEHLGAEVLVFCLAPIVSGQQTAQQASKNPFDLSAAREAMGGAVPTTSGVALLERQAQTLFATGDCKAAIDALERFANGASGLADLIAIGLQPFLKASHEVQLSFGESRLSRLAPVENLVYDYRAKRNHAMVMQAECLAKTGDTLKAKRVYYQALGSLEASDTAWWERARNGLYRILQVTAEPIEAPRP